MNSILKKAGNAVEACDFFAAPVLLRYKTEDDIKSKTGGCISILLIVLLVSAFYNSWISVFNKNDIKCQYQYIRQLDPSPLEITSESFVLAIGVGGISLLSGNQKYFDLEITYQQRKNSVMANVTYITMVPCQQRHFDHFTEQIKSLYQKQNLQNFLCLPDNFTAKITGKWASSQFNYLRIHIKNCTSNCYSSQDFENYMFNNGGFYIDYYLINKIINPTMKDPITYYFEDKFYDIINDKIAISSNLYISQYEIQTDESLWPLEQMNITQGFLIDRTQKQQLIHPVQNGTFVEMHFRKSDQKIKIQRVYRKIDDLFSYIGGLFGIIAAFFSFILLRYNKCCYQLEMSKKVFRDEDINQQDEITAIRQAVHCTKGVVQQPKQSKSQSSQVNFNFFTYIKLLISKIFFVFFQTNNWKEMETLNEKLEQTENQMNVDLILQKISFYQRALQCLFDEHQITLLLLQQKISIKQLKQQRLIMNFQDQPFLNKNKQTVQEQKANNKVANEHILVKQSSQIIIKKVNCEPEKQQQNALLLNIFQAIDQLRRQSRKGNEISQKILSRIRYDILKKYQEHMAKGKSLVKPRKLSNFSRFDISTKKMDQFLEVKQLEVPCFGRKVRSSLNQYFESVLDSRSSNQQRGSNNNSFRVMN